MNFPDIAIVGSYDYRLVALSVFIAILTSYAALDLSGRVTSAHGRARFLWHLLASGPPALAQSPLVTQIAVNQLLATRLLEKRGHRVVMTSNGQEVLAALAKNSYDLVSMDVQMPEMDGLQATAALREREKERGDDIHQPVIALTAHVMKGDRERCLAAGMDGFLTKPIGPQQLDKVLEKYLALRRESTNASEAVGPRR